jgi:hypothetical protein
VIVVVAVAAVAVVSTSVLAVLYAAACDAVYIGLCS